MLQLILSLHVSIVSTFGRQQAKAVNGTFHSALRNFGNQTAHVGYNLCRQAFKFHIYLPCLDTCLSV